MLNKMPERRRPLIRTAIITGMRFSEQRGLTWECVDFEKTAMHIRKRTDRYTEFGKPKSRVGSRSFPMTPGVIPELEAWMSRCPKGSLNLVFPNGAGKI